MTDAAIMTARMISMTSIGGLVVVWPKTYVSTNTPKLPHNPRPTPPYRLPIKMQASTTANSKQLTSTTTRLKFLLIFLAPSSAGETNEQERTTAASPPAGAGTPERATTE